jgi:hypothetical protein
LGGFSAEFYEEDDDEEQREDDTVEDRHEARHPEEDEYSNGPDHSMDGPIEARGYEDDGGDMDDLRFNNSGLGGTASADNYNTSQRSDLLRRSREEDLMDFRRSIEDSREGRQKDSMFGRIAKDMYNQMGIPSIEESDDLVISNEDLLLRLYDEGIRATEDENVLKESLEIIPAELLKLWADYSITNSPHVSEEYAAAIGPGPRASNFAKANFLASLDL